VTLNTPDLEGIYHAYTPIVPTASLRTNFDVSSFTHTTGAPFLKRSRDLDHAHLGAVYHPRGEHLLLPI